MAISIPTDLVMDVVRAANPAVAEKAEALLERAAGRKAERAASTPEFARQVASAEGFGLEDLRSRLAAQTSPTDKTEIPETYRKFEAMVLGNFVQSMLPTDNEELYGKGTAGDIWKGMMADQIGNVIAKGRGIGIAERMAAQAGSHAVPAGAFAENVVNQAASIVNELQMSVLNDLTGISARDTKSEIGKA